MRWFPIALLLMGLLAGCASVPVAGPVEKVPISELPRDLDFAPEPPQDEMEPTQLVDGFLQAMADANGDYEVARQYLTADAATTWVPSSQTAVFLGDIEINDENNVELVGTLLGRLDEVGRYASAGVSLRHDFKLVQVAGQWRISNPPEGLLLSRYLFERFYEHATIYFMSADGDYVIPDLIHLPEAHLSLDRLVAAQLAGPSSQISDVATNAIPEDVSLSEMGASIDIGTGAATIRLEGLPEDLDDEELRQLGAQLGWSATAITRVTGLIVESDDEPVALPGQDEDGVLELGALQSYQVLSKAGTTDLFGISEANTVRIAGTDLQPLDLTAEAAEMAVSLDGTTAAVIDSAGATLLIGPLSGPLSPVALDVSQLVHLQYAQGYFWVLGRDEQGNQRLIRIDRQGFATQVNLGSMAGLIENFEISQSASRVALITRNESGEPRLFTGSVSAFDEPRFSDFQPLVLTMATGEQLADYSDLAWSGETELVLIARADDTVSVFSASQDGSVVQDIGPLVVEPVSITALPRVTSDAVVIVTEQGAAWRYEPGNRWLQMGLELQQARFAG